jgi:Protein of unknown function (DUF3302)
MIDAFDLIAFVVFAVLLVAAVVIVVSLGSLPGLIARRRGHPQAAAVNVMSWIGLATGGILWPLALVWAFWKSSSAASPAPDAKADAMQTQARIDALEVVLRQLQGGKGAAS